MNTGIGLIGLSGVASAAEAIVMIFLILDDTEANAVTVAFAVVLIVRLLLYISANWRRTTENTITTLLRPETLAQEIPALCADTNRLRVSSGTSPANIRAKCTIAVEETVGEKNS